MCSLGPTRRILVLIAYHIFYSPCYGGNLGYACYLVVKSYLRYGSNHGLSIILHLSAMLEFGDTLEFGGHLELRGHIGLGISLGLGAILDLVAKLYWWPTLVHHTIGFRVS